MLLYCKSENVQFYTNCINFIYLFIHLTLQQFSEAASKWVNSYFNIETIVVFVNVLNRFHIYIYFVFHLKCSFSI